MSRFARAIEVGILSTGSVLTLRRLWSWWLYLNSAPYSEGMSAHRLWPLPAGYLLEVAVVSVALIPFVLMDSDRDSVGGRIVAVGAGALACLSFLGAWSIGTAVLPAALAALVVVVIAGVRLRRRPLPLLLWVAAGVVGQAALMALGIAALATGVL